ncbi:MucBP domain-containing protein, partial [Candidatus Saccharibacteria bacterium]|nr:MucBP domain-containing protein [Candidatus Saccharibacteria bacterium]
IIHEIEDADDITETKTVEYGDACPAQPKQDLLTAYTYTQSGDTCGDSVTSNLTVKYTYTLKRINLIVRHLNSSGGEIIPDQPHEYKYGASYNNIQPDPSLEQAYVCTTNDPTSGTIVAETTITFNCVKRKYTVTVHHIKSDGTKYAEDTVKSYDYGSDYTTTPIEDNNYTSELTEGTASGTVNGNIEVTYTYTRKIATIIVHHVDENGNPFVGVDDVIFTRPFGDNYETEASTDIPANYEFASRTNNHAGVVSSTPIEVTYRYQKKDPNLSTTVKIKNGNDTLTNESSTSEYDVVYNATVDGFYGSATIEIVNKLPYPVDQDNSDFGGGIYDPETNTITWTETVDVDTVPKNITITKPVKIVFKNVDPNDRAVNNRVSATTTLDTGKERTSTGDATISVKYTSKAIVHYYLKDTETSIKDDKEYAGLVGDEFTVKAVKIKGYKLVDSSPAKTYYFTTEVQEIIFEYTKIEPPAPTPKPENPNTDDGFSPLAFIGFSLFSTIGIGLVLRSLRLRRS